MTAQTITAPDTAPARLDRMADMPAGLSIPERSAYLAGYNRGLKAYVRKHGIPSLQEPAPAPGTAARRMFARRLSELVAAHDRDSHPPAHKAGMSALTRYRKVRGIPADVPAGKPAAAVKAPRKTTRFVLCDAHTGTSLGRGRELARWFAEGGLRGACTSAETMCHVIPGTDYYAAGTVSRDLWTGNAPADVTPEATPADVLAAGVESGRVIIMSAPAIPEPVTREDLTAAGITPASRVERVTPEPMPAEPAAADKPANRTRRAARRQLAEDMRAAGLVPAGEAWELAKRDAGLA